MISEKPYITFVMVGRNDNYGGDFISRAQASIDSILISCEKYGLNSEVIFVEWNPPSEKPALKNVLAWPEKLKYCRVKIIEVPPETHNKFPGAGKLPLFEYRGKNVGLRRASGEYILVTNPDIIFSDELIKWLARAKLSSEHFYRIARWDIKSLSLINDLGNILEQCKKNVIITHGYWHSHGAHFNPIEFAKDFFRYIALKITHSPFDYPFAKVAGDFFLMHKNNWYSLRGYPEKENNYFIDGYLCYMALAAGIKQRIISGGGKRIYHQKHWGRREADTAAIDEYRIARKRMLKEKKPIIFNDENWGLAGVKLKEYIL